VFRHEYKKIGGELFKANLLREMGVYEGKGK
jgi:hypothetical protein